MKLTRFRSVRKLLRDRLAIAAAVVIAIYVAAAALVWIGALGWVGADHAARVVTEEQEVAFYTAPSATDWKLWLGTDRQGRSILVRAIASILVAISVGVVTGIIAVAIGTVLGSIAGYFGGFVDDAIVWLYSTLQSIPYLLLLLVLSYVAGERFGKGLVTIYIAFGATFWTGPCRVVRGEVIKLRDSDFVTAAVAAGASPLRVVFQHVVPNVTHLSLIYFSLVFIGAVKAEVILSFLGLGVQDLPSWGVMINAAARGGLGIDFYWEIGAATAFMFLLVLAFNVFTDSLQDALDPKTT